MRDGTTPDPAHADRTAEGRHAGAHARGRPPKGAYRTAALVLLNSVTLFVALNLVLGAAFLARDTLVSWPEKAHAAEGLFEADGAPVPGAKRSSYQLRWFDYRAYEGIEPEFAAEVLDDFYDLGRLGFVHRPWVQFSEPPFHGNRVNVDLFEAGVPVRRTWNAPAGAGARVLRVFAFGGSTTFGYNVADEHTWPAFLSRILDERARAAGADVRVEVVNFGRGYYYPSQQAVLLTSLLSAGHRPDVVIFMDGVNCCAGEDSPRFSAELGEAFAELHHPRPLDATELLAELRWIPFVRLGLTVGRALGPPENGERGAPEPPWDAARIRAGINQFVQNARIVRALCERYGCTALFFLQPNPLVGYDLGLYRRDVGAAFGPRMEPIATIYGAVAASGAYADLSDLFQLWGEARIAIVDDVHYSPAFNEFLARRVAEEIDLDALGGTGAK